MGVLKWVAALAASVVVTSAGSATAALPRIDVDRGAKPALRTTDGRQTLMRGVNVNQLGDYYAVAPALPTVVELTADDFADIAALGLDHVRLIVNWSALEPVRGAFDTAYVGRIRQAVRQAESAGLHVVLDMHQDAWGKGVASEGEQCLPGFSPAQGWDGAPAWATLTDGLSKCRIQLREIAPAVGQAWTSFYADRAGIRTALVKTWGRLVREFAADTTVAGYDLLNEPNTGYTPLATGPTLLASFYAQAIKEIRRAERSVRGGFEHLVYFEPSVLWSAAAVDTVPLPGFTDDKRIVFAPHLYASSISADGALGLEAVSIENGFKLAAATASLHRTTFWSGEWGWFGDPARDLPDLLRYAREEDRHQVGGAWWSWKQACGDPHQFALPSREPFGLSPSLNRIECPSGRLLGIPATTARVLSRARPRYAPGRLTGFTSDPQTGALALAGADPDPRGSCVLDVWVPGAPRPSFTATGVAGLTADPVPGGWRVTGCAGRSYTLRVGAS